MKLDVIIPTFNRKELLARAVASLFRVQMPEELDVNVTVVDNNSADGTATLMAELMKKYGGRLRYVFEARQGRSHALNAGIAATDGELVAMFDDDEEIDPSWYTCVHSAFKDSKVDFIGGPYKPRWGAAPPRWLPTRWVGLIGLPDFGDQVIVYGTHPTAFPIGGNTVVRRSVLQNAGSYNTSLGVTGKKRMSGEDDAMYHALLDLGAYGLYLPDLKIYHYISPQRLTKQYFRSATFWSGVSVAIMERERPHLGKHIGRIPKVRIEDAFWTIMELFRNLLTFHPDPAQLFSYELAMWQFAGFVYGKYRRV